MILIEVLPSVVFGIAVLAVPESPRYLVQAGRDADALTVLRRVEGGPAEGHLSEIQSTLKADRPPRFSDLRDSSGRIKNVVWIGVGLAVLQQLVGINSIFYYGAALWNSVGFTPAHSLEINVVTGIVNIGSTLVAIALVDRIGRRLLLLVGSAAMAVALGALVWALLTGGVTGQGATALSPRAAEVALVAANLFVFAFGASWGPCVWILLGEMFPNRIRGAAMAVAVFGQWIANWLVTMTFPPLVESFGPAIAYALYFVAAVFSFIFVWRGVRETCGLRLEEMDKT